MYYPKDINNDYISASNAIDMFIVDYDNDMQNEAVINQSDRATSLIYDVINITNWNLTGTGIYIQCIGDWDNDGYCDIVFSDGRVQLGVPEANSILILVFIMAGVLKRSSAKYNQ